MRALGAARRLLSTRHGRAAEVAMAVGGLAAYNLVRAQHLADREVAVANARRIADAERRAGLVVEPAVQRLPVRGPVSRSVLGAAYIASQIIILPLALRTALHRGYPAYPGPCAR